MCTLQLRQSGACTHASDTLWRISTALTPPLSDFRTWRLLLWTQRAEFFSNKRRHVWEHVLPLSKLRTCHDLDSGDCRIHNCITQYGFIKVSVWIMLLSSQLLCSTFNFTHRGGIGQWCSINYRRLLSAWWLSKSLGWRTHPVKSVYLQIWHDAPTGGLISSRARIWGITGVFDRSIHRLHVHWIPRRNSAQAGRGRCQL